MIQSSLEVFYSTWADPMWKGVSLGQEVSSTFLFFFFFFFPFFFGGGGGGLHREGKGIILVIFYHLAVIWSPLTPHFFKILDPSLFHNMEKLSYTFSSGLAKCLLDLQILAGLTHMCTKYRAVRHVLAFLFKTCRVIGRPGGYL